ncbi:uncharacterized protein BDR25DRAFT_376489 [Lindgomyces ingoldianus]|uniref:Uncharacterized protein n=1 Tax=Lindgomyces ingoldianus TaxID=673940 RepID=A0ACB6QKU7_9PLEO|nr:uncharacterized protein BDR25DRAFT_376489 [Lindgomyces ingoldianus]KAF2466932.1 hypothetical protein BDR25DRAFT_376489 [Lindgomyces ingoldianus]
MQFHHCQTAIIVTETIHQTVKTTSTSTATTTTGYPRQCIVPRNVHLERKDEVPSCCKCFLTTTKKCGTATSTVTKTAITPLVTKTITVYSTVFSATINKTTQLATSTATSTTINTSTITSSITIVDSTQTSTTTSTTTVAFDACATPFTLGINRKPSSLNVQLGMTGDTGSLTQCCENCYMNKNCVYYAVNAAVDICYVSFSKKTGAGCVTAECPLGLQDGDLLSGDGNTYGFGPCSSGFVA